MFRRFFAGDKGNVSIIFVLTLVPMTLSAGIAIDYVRLLSAQTTLQSAVDAAALAGASFDDGSTAERTTAATKAFERNSPSDLPVSAPSISVGSGTITVSAIASLDPALMNIGGFHASNIAANAAVAFQATPSCLIALNPTETKSIYIKSGSKVVATDCAVQVNSTDAQALYGESNGDITASAICVGGGWSANSGSEFTLAPTTCSPITDPLAWLPVPPEADDGCNFTNKTYSATHTLSPGVYCGKTEFKSGAIVTLLPGTYVFRDGELVVNSNSDVAGDGVMFYLTGINNARFSINSNSEINISAPTTGTYAGIAIFQERNSTADYSVLNSNSNSQVEGVIYLPDTALHLNSNGSLNGSLSETTPWTIVVADKVEVNSNSTLNVNANYESSLVPLPAGLTGGSGRMVRLTE